MADARNVAGTEIVAGADTVGVAHLWRGCGADVAYDTLAKVKIEVSTVTYFSV